MKEELLLLRKQLKMGHRISFAEAMLLQKAIDILVSKAGNLPVNDVTAGKLFTKGDVVTAESLTTINPAPTMELLPQNAESLTGNSPTQSDCCPAQNVVAPAQNQGWIPVSERMPEDEQEVLTINKMGHRFVSFFDKHSGLFFDRLDAPAACCIEHVLVTHWMPLPSAPQEVMKDEANNLSPK